MLVWALTAYINNDAQLCVAIGNFAGQPTTLHCQVRAGTTYHSEVFTEQSHRAGLAGPTLRMVTFGVFFFDADLDGLQDLFMVNGHVANEERLRNVPYAQPHSCSVIVAMAHSLRSPLFPAPAWIDVSLGEGPPTRIMIMTEIWISCSLPIRARPICCAMIRHARGAFYGWRHRGRAAIAMVSEHGSGCIPRPSGASVVWYAPVAVTCRTASCP